MARINSESEYKAIMARVDELFFATDDDTPAEDPRLYELDVLSALVEEYEKEHFPIEIPSLSSTIRERMLVGGYTLGGLSEHLGISMSRLSDIVNGKKEPTYQQARVIAQKLDIDPAIVLNLK